MACVTVNVTVQNETQSTTVKQSSSGPAFDIIISVLAALCVISLGVLLYLWLRGKPKPQLGACSAFKYNNIDYFKTVACKQNESIIKNADKLSETC